MLEMKRDITWMELANGRVPVKIVQRIVTDEDISEVRLMTFIKENNRIVKSILSQLQTVGLESITTEYNDTEQTQTITLNWKNDKPVAQLITELMELK